MLRLNHGYSLDDEIDYELGAPAKKKKKKPAPKARPAARPAPKRAAKKAPAKRPPPKRAPVKAKPKPAAKATPRRAPVKRAAPKPRPAVKAKPRPVAKAKPRPVVKAKPKPVVTAKPAPAPDGSMATLKARLAVPEAPPPSPLLAMAQASPHVPPDYEPPEALPPEEEEAAPEAPEEEAPEEEEAEPEPEEEEEAPEEASEEEDAEGVELGQLVQHVRATVKPTLRLFPSLKLQTANVSARAQAGIKGACQCSQGAARKVRAKLNKKLQTRGYPAGASDKLLAGIVELTARLDALARAKATKVATPKARLKARALELTRRLPITHPVRCRAVRLMLTCEP